MFDQIFDNFQSLRSSNAAKKNRFKRDEEIRVLEDWNSLAEIGQKTIDIARDLKNNPSVRVSNFWNRVWVLENEGLPLTPCFEEFFSPTTAHLLGVANDNGTIYEATKILSQPENVSQGFVKAFFTKNLMMILYLVSCLAIGAAKYPSFAGLYEDANGRIDDWVFIAKAGYCISSFLYHYGLVIVCIALVLIYILHTSISNWIGVKRNKMSHQLSVYKTVRYIESANLFRMLALLRKIGVPIIDSLSFAQGSKDKYTVSLVKPLYEGVSRGDDLYTVITADGLLDAEENSIVAAILQRAPGQDVELFEKTAGRIQVRYRRIMDKMALQFKVFGWTLICIIVAAAGVGDMLAKIALVNSAM